MSERNAADADCWLPIIGLCVAIPVWLWRRLTPGPCRGSTRVCS
jgi:hypothetical protein